MSNSLDKKFVAIYSLIPGYTVKRWNPPVTTTRVVYYTTTTIDPVPRVIRDKDIVNRGIAIDSHALVSIDKDGITIYETRVVTSSDVITTTIPGYFTYDYEPDTYSISYDPNLGWNSSARSIPTILGDGTATFSVGVDDVGAVVGFNEIYDSSGNDYFEITYGIYFSRGTYRVVESGVIKSAGLTYAAEDTFSIERAGEQVSYIHNGNVFYNSIVPSYQELLLDCSLYSAGDGIYNASLVEGTSIEMAGAALSMSSDIIATPKAAAILSGESSLLFSGVYYIDNDLYVSGTSIVSSDSSLVVVKCFGSALLSAVATVTATGHSTTGVAASMSAMTCLATSGYESYAAINASFPAMRAQAGAGELSNTVVYMMAAMPAMTANAHSIIGQGTLPSTMTMNPMQAFGTAHAGSYDYKSAAILGSSSLGIVAKGFSILSGESLLRAGSYSIGTNATYISSVNLSCDYSLIVGLVSSSAECIATSSLVAGSYRIGNDVYVTKTAIAGSSILASLPFRSSAELSASAIFKVGHYSISGMESHAAGVALSGYATLDSTQVFAYASLGGSALLSNPGDYIMDGSMFAYAGISASMSPMIAFAVAGEYLTNFGELPFVDFSISGRAHSAQQNYGEIEFTELLVEGFGGAIGSLSMPLLSISGDATNPDMATGNLEFVKFTLSGSATVFGNATGKVDFMSSTITGYGGGFAAITFPDFSISGTGTNLETGSGSIDFVKFSISGTGIQYASAIGFIDFPVFDTSYVSGNITFATFDVFGISTVAVANAIAYVINMHTEESYKWTNQDFMHIIKIGNKPYGVKANGLYAIQGATDGTTAINASITTKDTDFGSYQSKRLQYVYLNSDTQTTVTPTVDGVIKLGQDSSFNGRKVKMAMGNRGRYWKLKIEHIVKLEGAEILPAQQQMRVK